MAVAHTPPARGAHSARNTTGDLRTAPLAQIRPSSWINPRRVFDEDQLRELAESILEHGLLEPIVVRETDDGAFEILAGERRFRACQIAGVSPVPIHNRGRVDDATAVQLALIENLHRQDLDPIEEAEGYAQLNRIAGMKQSEIGEAVRRSQSSIANRMRLLDLPEEIRTEISAGTLSPAHGLALLKYTKWPKLFAWMVKQARAGVPSKRLEKGFGEDGFSVYDAEQAGALVRLDGLGLVWNDVHDSDLTIWAHYGGEVNERNWYWLYTPDVEQAKEILDARRKREQAVASRRMQKVLDQEKVEGVTLPRLERMQNFTYVRLSDGDGPVKYAPAGCGNDCVCRARALDDDGRVVIISTDPAHINELRAKEERHKQKERKAEYRSHAEQLDEILAGRPAMDSIGLAVLASSRLWQSKKPTLTRLHAQYLSDLFPLETLTDYGKRRDIYTDLAKLPAETLVRLLVEAVLRDQMADHITYGSMDGGLAWYMEKAGASTPYADMSLDDLQRRASEARRKLSQIEVVNAPKQSALWQATLRQLEERIEERKREQRDAAMQAKEESLRAAAREHAAETVRLNAHKDLRSVAGANAITDDSPRELWPLVEGIPMRPSLYAKFQANQVLMAREQASQEAQ